MKSSGCSVWWILEYIWISFSKKKKVIFSGDEQWVLSHWLYLWWSWSIFLLVTSAIVLWKILKMWFWIPHLIRPLDYFLWPHRSQPSIRVLSILLLSHQLLKFLIEPLYWWIATRLLKSGNVLLHLHHSLVWKIWFEVFRNFSFWKRESQGMSKLLFLFLSSKMWEIYFILFENLWFWDFKNIVLLHEVWIKV